MRTLTKILVVVDTRLDTNIALNRARLLAKATDKPVFILAPNPHPSEATQAKMQDMLALLKDEGIDVKGQEAWHNGVVETINHFTELEGCSLVIKAAKKSSMITNVISTPEDWTLLRHSQEPVLLVHHDHSWMNGRVLAAVDACPNDSEHEVLNGVILEYAAAIAGISDSECHIGSAHPGTTLSGDDPISKSSADTHVRYEQQCQPLAKRFAIADEHVHIEEGPAEAFIPTLCKRINASLLVMGTVAHTSLRIELLGDTAEQILNNIETDILCVKPLDIMEPLEKLMK
ncbi:universal stress protein [Sansalvadorimonas sp. 2012CJ34-2]|uniref:Universal stress protein n=1 Tax=Parendozoicomonas callyspongiae TaxID=2942213 RepID=A0ABT0PBT8_9GAMM|nr:universal stress protein [Sansalvadorimonas sp. 2012CJ34-2]MCL6268716.1 universal stress protein [Sansalvadorimonas sp. 2012CJ34-2]